MIEREARRRERRWFVLLGVILAVAAVVTVVVVLVVGVVMIPFVVWRRRRGSALFARSPLWELPDRRERTALVRALRRGDPIPPERRDLARRVAHDVTRRRALPWMYLVTGGMFAVLAYLVPDATSHWLLGAVVLLYVGLAAYSWWLARQVRRSAALLDARSPGDVTG